MGTAALMAKLLELERRAGSDDGSSIRAIALAAQDDLLELERTLVAALNDLVVYQKRGANPQKKGRCATSKRAAVLPSTLRRLPFRLLL